MERFKQLHKKESAGKKIKSRPASRHKSHNRRRPDAFRDMQNYLQKKYGNYMVGRMVESGWLQAQLKISQPGDAYEREADQAADKVMSMPVQAGAVHPSGQTGGIYRKVLNDIPEATRKKITVNLTGYNIATALPALFNPGIQYIYSDTAASMLSNVEWGGVVSDLQPGLKNVAGSLLDGALKKNDSITLALDFATAGFATYSQYAFNDHFGDTAKAKLLQRCVYRFTRYEDTSGDAPVEKILIEELGAYPSAALTVEQKAANQGTFDAANFTFLAGGDANTQNFTDGEKQAVCKIIAQLPAKVRTAAAGIRWKRATAAGADAGLYTTGEHTITLYENAFAAGLTVTGNAGNGFHTLLEQTIVHELGHAVDYKGLEDNRRKAATLVAEYNGLYGKYRLAFDAYRKLFAEYDGLAKVHGSMVDDYNKTVLQRGEMVKKYNAYVEQYNKKNSPAIKSAMDKLALSMEELKKVLARKMQDLAAKEKLVKEADEKVAESQKQYGAWEKLMNEKKAEQTEHETGRKAAVSPSGVKDVLTADTWGYKSGTTDTTFRTKAKAAGATEQENGTIKGAITAYAGTNWKEYFAEAFALYFTDRERMQLTKPEIYNYFHTEYGA